MTAEGERRAVAVIGSGIMGAGIAQLVVTAGYEVAVADPSAAARERADAAIRAGLGKFVAKGRLDADTAAAAAGRVRFCADVRDAAADAGTVVEAVVEDLGVKQAVLAAAAEVAAPDALLGTNTSQLSITAVAGTAPGVSERVIGLHFFNPPVLMRLVEIVCGLRTAAPTLAAARAFATSLGKETVVCRKDSPGFLTSRISAIVRLECLRMLEEGVGTAEDIDRALQLGLNFPIGPLELGDRNGLDTYLRVLESLSDTLGERFRPTVGLRNLVAAGRLGTKTGSGIHEYTEDGARKERGRP